ncbi:cytochrome P450 [Penicillium alfredii]|uniref:Cytochrome P450 n=1 Tax=Penicillium alfredii TaxID=1506179 RepID=A0A9W9F1B7_9EURO|nr:cytochrome P450 [Penicillium alfredii]KAJ5091774.1 cytochrome P450 [Penicillium alfredii]
MSREIRYVRHAYPMTSNAGLKPWLNCILLGPVIRYTPNTVMWNNTTGLRDIYGVRRKVHKTSNYRFLDQGVANILTLSNKDVHASRRRLLNSRFTDKTLKEFKPRLLYHVQKLCNALNPSQTSYSGL